MNEQDPTEHAAGEIPAEERTLALVAHLLGLVTGFVGPLVMYLVLEGQPAAKREAREALNFQIFVMIGGVISAVLTLICVGYLTLIALGILSLVFSILGAIEAGQGRPYRYPLTLRLIQ